MTTVSRAPVGGSPFRGGETGHPARPAASSRAPIPAGASYPRGGCRTSISLLCISEQISSCRGLDRRRFPALAAASPIALTPASRLSSEMRTTHASQLLALLVVSTLAITSAQNVTQVLSNYPQFSTATRLLVETEVIKEIQSRSSITLLLPDNGVLDPYVASHPSYTTQELADVLRYHVLLQYFGGQELATTLTSVGYTVTTLYQTTGRANDLNGFVNLTKTATGTVTVGPSAPLSPPQANIITNITQYPYNYSFVQISAVLEPLGLVSAPTPAPALGPITAPVGSPLSPVESPIESPGEAPVNGPVSTPPVAGGPVAEGPGVKVASNAAYAVGFNAVAVFASLAVAAMLL